MKHHSQSKFLNSATTELYIYIKNAEEKMIQRSLIKTHSFRKHVQQVPSIYNKDRSIVANIFSTDIETDW